MSDARSSGRWFIGVLFILLGVVFFLHLPIGRLVTVGWPVILIAAGVSHLLSRDRQPGSGLFLVALGAFFLAINLGWIGWDIVGRLWPLILIALGVSMLLGWDSEKKRAPDTVDTTGMNVFFSGARRVITAQSWTGGDVSAVFGGLELDLRGATLAPEGAVLTLSSVFGGVKIFVPADWDVRIEGSPIFGGLVDSRVRPSALESAVRPRLTIKATAVFGGVEVSA